MNSKSNNIEIIINNKADEVTEELFQSLRCRYQFGFSLTIARNLFYAKKE